MRTTLAFLFILTFYCSSLSAQNFVYTPQQHMQAYAFDGEPTYFDHKISTPQAEDIQYAWELVSNELPATWSYSLCDYGGCYVGIPQAGTMLPISTEDWNNDEEAYFRLYISCGDGNYGRGTVTFYVYEVGYYERGDTVSMEVIYDKDIQSAQDLLEPEVSLNSHPNPFSDQLYFQKNNFKKLHYKLVDMHGRIALSGIFEQKTDRINTAQLRTGLYLLEFTSEDGEKNYFRLVKE